MSICDCGNEFMPAAYGNGARMCNSCRANRRRWVRKLQCIEYLGGKCVDCGYNKCPQALDFHHIDPHLKSFTVSGKCSLSWENLKLELSKCILLCACCHRERHWKERSDKTYMTVYAPVKRLNKRKEERRVRRETKFKWPPVEAVVEMVRNTSFSEVSRKLGISDNAIRKFFKRYDIDPKDIRSIKDNRFK